MLVRSALHRDARKLPLAREVENIIRRQSLAFNGVWFDPSDLSTMFQDSAGTTPVTAVGQPVGLILDKSKGLALGPELVANGDFSNGTTGWSAYSAIAGGVISNSSNTLLVSNNGGTYARGVSALTGLTIGKTYQVTGTCITSSNGAVVRIATASDAASGYVYNNTALTIGPIKFVFSATATTLYLAVGIESSAQTATASFDNISVRELPGNHATQSTAGYKPLLQSENGLNYLAFDGLDDFLVTGNIDFSSSDKIAVAAGVRKLSDAAAGIVAETSSNALANNGAFGIYGPSSGGTATYGCGVRGTVATSTNSVGFASPNSAIVSCIEAIGSDDLRLRANGVQIGASFADQGAGNFGNYPLYIGRRGGTSLPFNGRLYGLAICGGMDDIYKLKKIEQYLAKKTGVII